MCHNSEFGEVVARTELKVLVDATARSERANNVSLRSMKTYWWLLVITDEAGRLVFAVIRRKKEVTCWAGY